MKDSLQNFNMIILMFSKKSIRIAGTNLDMTISQKHFLLINYIIYSVHNTIFPQVLIY